MNPDRSNCTTCGGTGRVERPTTVDHILTDTKPWAPCPKGCKPCTDAEMRLREQMWRRERGIYVP